MLFLFFFAADAEFGDGAGFEAFDADFFAAGFAGAVFALFDFLQGFVDFAEQGVLAVAQPQVELLARFGGGLVNFVGEIVGINAHALFPGMARRHADLLFPFEEYLFETLHFFLVHGRASFPNPPSLVNREFRC